MMNFSDASWPAPYADDEVHRHQHQLPEHVKEEEIERDEGAEHAGLEREQEEEVLLDAVGDVIEREQHHHRREEGGEENEEQAHAIDPDQVLDPEVGHPGVALEKLKVALAGLKI